MYSMARGYGWVRGNAVIPSIKAIRDLVTKPPNEKVVEAIIFPDPELPTSPPRLINPTNFKLFN